MNIGFLNIYYSKKIFLVFVMGIASGIPLYMILSTLFIWLTRENIDISTVGLFALTQIPWSLKFIWAPFIDNYKIPILSNYLGQRKSWLLITQILLIFSLIFPTSFVSFNLDSSKVIISESIVSISSLKKYNFFSSSIFLLKVFHEIC